MSEENSSDEDSAKTTIIWTITISILAADVFFLADIVENFREVCMTYCGLDPVQYDAVPNFAFALYQTLLMILTVRLTCVEIA